MSIGYSKENRRIHGAHDTSSRNGNGVAAESPESNYSHLSSYRRIVILTEGCSNPAMAKTAMSLLRYRTNDIAAVWDSSNAGKSAEEVFGMGGQVPVVESIDKIVEPDALFIGLAFAGGALPKQYRPLILQALRQGVDVVSGLHDFLASDHEFVTAAAKYGSRLIDVRHNTQRHIATSAAFSPDCLRVHTVGQDCSVGKMTTALQLEEGLRLKGHDAAFLATGQTGIMLRGAGVPIDCVVSDFVNGAVENLVLSNQNHDFLLIEGQGSIVHPAFSAVNLGLLHGCAPDALILCYEIGRKTVKGLDHLPVTPLAELIRLYEFNAAQRNPCKVIGISMNSSLVSFAEAEKEKRRLETEFGIPACDVFRHGAGELVDSILAARRHANPSSKLGADKRDALQDSSVAV